MMDVAMAARKLHVSRETIRRRIADGSLLAYKVGVNGNVRILERNLDELLVPYTPPRGTR